VHMYTKYINHICSTSPFALPSLIGTHHGTGPVLPSCPSFFSGVHLGTSDIPYLFHIIPYSN
jgi:hypothetical protein